MDTKKKYRTDLPFQAKDVPRIHKNPEINKWSQLANNHTGPKTKWKKLRQDVGRIKGQNNHYLDYSKSAKNSMLRRMVVDAKCPLGVNCPECRGKTPERGCRLRYKLFYEAIKNDNIDMMTEIHELLATVKVEMTIELKKLHDKGESPGRNLLTLMKLVKDVTMEGHKAKHGIKLNAHIKKEVTIEDIRAKMFKDTVYNKEGEPVGEVIVTEEKKKKKKEEEYASHS